jgi:hypothetical protein
VSVFRCQYKKSRYNPNNIHHSACMTILAIIQINDSNDRHAMDCDAVTSFVTPLISNPSVFVSHPVPDTLYEISSDLELFSVEVIVWWEWFPTTILDGGPTEFIAVGNRSHKIFKLCSGTKKASSSIKLAILPMPVNYRGQRLI